MKRGLIAILALIVVGVVGCASYALTASNAIPTGNSWSIISLYSGDKVVSITNPLSGFDILLAGDTTVTESADLPQYYMSSMKSSVSFPFIYFSGETEKEGVMLLRAHDDLANCFLNPMFGGTDNISGYKTIGGVDFSYTTYYGSSNQPTRTLQYSAIHNGLCYQFVATKDGYESEPLDSVFSAIRFFDIAANGIKTYLTPEVSLRLPINMITKCPDYTRVYEVISEDELGWFKNEAVFLGRGHAWSELRTASCDDYTDYTVTTYDFPTDALVKFVDSPAVYAVETDCSDTSVATCDDVLTHIENETAAALRYGSDWASKIVELPAYALNTFTSSGEEITAQSEAEALANRVLPPDPWRSVTQWLPLANGNVWLFTRQIGSMGDPAQVNPCGAKNNCPVESWIVNPAEGSAHLSSSQNSYYSSITVTAEETGDGYLTVRWNILAGNVSTTRLDRVEKVDENTGTIL